MVAPTTGIKKLYYSIGEVSKITGIKPYVLRYWQTEFKQLNPPKNRAGNRTYRQKDIELIQQIKSLLYDQKYTIEGARKFLEEHKDGQPVAEPSHSPDLNQLIKSIRQELLEILHIIRE
ncbi:MAG: MerR family transcriptional regulator [Fidelibacterota bacterium]